MSLDPSPQRPIATARQKLLDAAVAVIRTKGYSATTIDQLCATAGVAKGSFFHHFKDKEALGVAAAEYWSDVTGALFAAAAYHQHADPLDRVLSYIDFRKAILTGGVPEFTCLVGTMVQEVYETSPAIRDACNASISGHAATLEPDIAEAIARYRVPVNITARSLALHTQAVLQGAYVLAKAKGNAAIAAESIDHLRRYVVALFGADRAAAKKTGSTKEHRA
jgi:TetR/AcrR family transcriptional repressor of nem operon